MVSLSLTSLEKKVLHKKYKASGLDSGQAWEKVKKMTAHLERVVKKLKKQGHDKEEINERFKIEFYKMVEKEEKNKKKGRKTK